MTTYDYGHSQRSKNSHLIYKYICWDHTVGWKNGELKLTKKNQYVICNVLWKYLRLNYKPISSNYYTCWLCLLTKKYFFIFIITRSKYCDCLYNIFCNLRFCSNISIRMYFSIHLYIFIKLLICLCKSRSTISYSFLTTSFKYSCKA